MLELTSFRTVSYILNGIKAMHIIKKGQTLQKESLSETK